MGKMSKQVQKKSNQNDNCSNKCGFYEIKFLIGQGVEYIK